MTDPIKPALTPEGWASVQRGNGIPYAYGSSVLDELCFLEGKDNPAAIAYLNNALPASDPRKIRSHWVSWLREEAEVLSRHGAGAGALIASEIAAALESYLPPITPVSKE